MVKRILLVLLVLAICILTGCSLDYRNANDAAVEELRQQLLHGKFDEVFDRSSSLVRSQLTRKEFLEKMKEATAELKSIDEGLNWHRDERGSPEEGVYREENWSSLNLERGGRKVNIQLDWGIPFELCGMLISGDISEGGIRVFRNCD